MRSDLFVAAAVWSVAEAFKLIQASKKLKLQSKCPSFNETIDNAGSKEFVKLSVVSIKCVPNSCFFFYLLSLKQIENKSKII